MTKTSALFVAIMLVGVSTLLVSTAVQAAVPNEPAKESPHPPSIALWPNGAPGSEARKDEPEKVDWREEPENNITFPVVFNIHNPSITPFLPDKAKATGAAIIIAPGGGHMFHTIDREGYDLAKWFADNGVAAFVLKYRLARDRAGNSPYKTDPDALNDAKRAVRLVRSRASEWGIDAGRVGFCGFSAGGHLAGLLAIKSDKGDSAAADPIEKLSSRPDFIGLLYGLPPAAVEFTDQTPPAFLMCAYDDHRNAVNLANAFLKLKELKVPAELHIYGTGGHGFGVRSDRSIASETWPARMRDWMKDIGMLTKR